MRSHKNNSTGPIKLQLAFAGLTLCLAMSGMAAEPEALPNIEISVSRLSPEFLAAQRQAKSDDRDPRAREWHKQGTPGLGPLLTPLLEPCRNGMTETPTVTVLLKLNASGKAQQVLTSDGSPFGECLRASLQSLDQGSAPWDGFWNEIVLKGFSRPPPLLTIVADSCKAMGDGKSAQPSLVITGATPATGTAVTKDTVISLSVAYSVRSTTGKYMLSARFRIRMPGSPVIGAEPVAFPLPASCGSSGSFTAQIRPGMFWDIPDLGDSLKIELALTEGEPRQFYAVANSTTVEFPKR